MPIPKIIYQTWKTVDLPPNVITVRERMIAKNPEYTFHLYDDDAIDTFIRVNFNGRIYSAFSTLKLGAAKADFWRYCVLYKTGGIYLDIDSEILLSLNNLIDFENDTCIIIREGNPGVFNNWIMIFEKEHPILERVIELCCRNIEICSKTEYTNVCYLTGPRPYTTAVNEILVPTFCHAAGLSCSNLYFVDDDVLNTVLNHTSCPIRSRFYGVDMGEYAKFKHEYSECLYENHLHWSNDPNIFHM